MKTYTSITYISGPRNEESTSSFIRPYSAKKPTFTGAARMVAARHNFNNPESPIRPSEISVTRIEYSDYQTR